MSRPGSIWRGGQCLWPRARIADDALSRAWGLLGKHRLEPEQALWLTPCAGVHMWGMRFPLDLLWLDAHGRILALREGLQPWRWAWPRQEGVVATVEAAAGSIERLGLAPGQDLEWRDAMAADLPPLAV